MSSTVVPKPPNITAYSLDTMGDENKLDKINCAN